MTDTHLLFRSPLTTRELVGWLVLIIVPPTLYFLMFYFSVNHEYTVFTLIAIATTVIIVFNLLPMFITGTFFLLATMLSGLAPERIVFSGFLSSSFYMILSLLALSYVVSSSGLLIRMVRWLLSIVPPQLRILELALSSFFVLLTAIITPGYARAKVVLNTIEAIDNSIDFPDRESYLNRLIIVCFFSSAIFSTSFMNGAGGNLFYYSLLDPTTQANIGWLTWFVYALPITITNLLGLLLIYFIKFRHSVPLVIKANTHPTSTQLSKKLSLNEKIAIISIITLIAGIGFSSVTHIQPPWVAMSVFFLLMITGLIDSTTFKRDIDWPFLFFVGGMMGLSATMAYLDITSVLNEKLWFLQTLLSRGDIYLLLICVFFLNLILLSLIGIVAPVIIIIMLSPSLQAIGASPWVLVATGCVALQCWLLPSQVPTLIALSEAMSEKKYGPFSKVWLTELCVVAINFIGFVISIFYWDYLELI